MIYLSVFTLILVSTISALPAPRVIYSAVIYNAQDSPVSCCVVWSPMENTNLDNGQLTIETNTYHSLKENTIDMDGWQAAATIETIICGDLSISAPFDNVNSPAKCWEFHVKTDKIVSVGPSSNCS